MAKKRQTFSVPPTAGARRRDLSASPWPAREVVKLRVLAGEAIGFREKTTGPGLQLTGPGDTDFRCGACDATVAAGTWRNEFDGVAVACPACGVYGVDPEDETVER